MTDTWNPLPQAEGEVVGLLTDLIRIDTSNWGESSETVGEIEAADYCAERLREAGWSPEVFTTTGVRRAGVYLRVAGTDPAAPALLLHGHLDVVPAIASAWSRPPFAGEVDSGFVWGRGAVDMKDMDAMILAVVRGWGFTGIRPRRDVVILFLPDEEAGSRHGAHWLAANRPEMFHGVTEAVGEVGGFSITVRDDLRLYPIQTAEKGMRWIRLQATGRAGHGSMLHDDNAITELCEAVTRVARHNWPLRITATVEVFLAELADAYGVELDPREPAELLRRLGCTCRSDYAQYRQPDNA